MKTPSFLVLAVAATALLAGCSAGPGGSGGSTSAAAPPSAAATPASTPTAAPSADAASGSRIEGTGYAYAVPDGWGEPDTDVGQSATDSFAADLEDADGFADNVNVIVLPSGAVTPDQIESQGPAQLEGAGATKVRVRDRVTVAGAESAHLTALTAAGGTKYRVDQFYLTHEGQTYVVTFSASPKVSQADRDEVSGSVLSSWTWS